MSAILFNKQGEAVSVNPRDVGQLLSTGDYYSTLEKQDDIYEDGIVTIEEARDKAKALGIKTGRKGLAKLLEEIKAAEDAEN